ncbi:amino acid ABC transporter permease [Desulfoferrobacter suflitae]|uniref:amino acid ABC transporter permease n=1 Tax=Desulfoferrobacter suflitae TaxID=2865782 RepID=UPI0021648F4E|nr:amino acid ABC transporter permease [Desulfoferrobacter suflitae]MCK8602156.1 amino acid ABC transporter permease [Desulfoferrobacter suflitae]
MTPDPKDPSQLTHSAGIPFWHDPAKRSVVYQAVALVLVFLAGYYIFSNTQANLRRQSIATGFGFLQREAGFAIGESMISYSAANTYARALFVGVLNTLRVAFAGIVLTVFLGIIVGIARLSTNWLVSRLAAAYIEVLQNIPVLLQLFFWYAIFHDSLPLPRQSFNPLPGVFVNNRGFYFPVPASDPVYPWMGAALLAALAASWLMRRWAKKRQDKTGKRFPALPVAFAMIVAFPLVVWTTGGAPTHMNMPHLRGFNFAGGISVSPEFAALLLGLVLYTSAFVAEIVRAGIQAISRGQTEAAMSLGLRPGLVLTLIILPQALRVIIPPLTSQMLNLTKNSSLAVAIGYPDFVSVANTTINQTGQAIEGVLMIMIVYLFFSLATSAYMNWYNKKKALVER